MSAVATALLGPVTPGRASFPGQNGKIAFHRLNLATAGVPNPNGTDLFVMSPDGTDEVSLGAANSNRNDRDPAWSADGERIAFASDRSGNYEIYTARADGTDVVRVTTDPPTTTFGVSDLQPAWSPDGTQIAYTRNNNIMVIGVNGAGMRALTNDGAQNLNPSWSPDGRRVAFQKLPPQVNYSDIFVVNADGTGPRNLTQTTLQNEREPSWAPSGARIAFERDSDIYTMNEDGSGALAVTTDKFVLDDREPSWSPDGSRIAFRSVRGDSADSTGLFVVAVDGSGRTRLTNPTVGDQAPDWQPLRLSVEVDPEGIDFGDITVGATSESRSATVKNTGLGVLHIGTVVLGGANPGDFLPGADGCAGQSRGAGQVCEIVFRFRPTALGPRTATVTITDDAPGSPRAVSLRGRGIAGTTTDSTGPTTTQPPAPGATLVLQPPIGPPGFVTLAVGSGFAPGTTVSLRWQPGLGETKAVTDAAGTFRVPVLVFHHDILGPRQLVAGLVSGPAFTPVPLTAPFLVVAPAIQPGDFVLRG